MLSFALVFAGTFDGERFAAPSRYERAFYRELKPISDHFQPEALQVNGLDRDRLLAVGIDPAAAMTEAAEWVIQRAKRSRPVLVAYPLSFDWSWLYWYFVRFSQLGSPFCHSQCFDVKTAFAVKARIPISKAGRSQIPALLRPAGAHRHHARADAIEQAKIFAALFRWEAPGACKRLTSAESCPRAASPI
ncbi:MAG: hypothetical protein ACRD2F_02855 [Terriglobales bacterium]